MHAAGPKNPLHGITLEMMVTRLQAHYGWEMLGRMIKINCFNWQPSIQSSLKFLRKTPWARAKVEELYISTIPDFEAAEPPAAEPASPDQSDREERSEP
ncbi:VF530 family DNA-binding protein [Prosthecobacter sp.]|uniref:VF530 family protein n=1 Tax=Prosthecobacter sp. TaxID=1965333 RepID=UPI00378339B2